MLLFLFKLLIQHTGLDSCIILVLSSIKGNVIAANRMEIDLADVHIGIDNNRLNAKTSPGSNSQQSPHHQNRR